MSIKIFSWNLVTLQQYNSKGMKTDNTYNYIIFRFPYPGHTYIEHWALSTKHGCIYVTHFEYRPKNVKWKDIRSIFVSFNGHTFYGRHETSSSLLFSFYFFGNHSLKIQRVSKCMSSTNWHLFFLSFYSPFSLFLCYR